LKFLIHISKTNVKVQISKPLKHRFFNLMQVAGVSTAGIAL